VEESTPDRRFPASDRMGNGKYPYGDSVFLGNHIPGAQRELDLVLQGSEFCLKGSLFPG